jgi:drug/metabolite transporter (DMT)-like permease
MLVIAGVSIQSVAKKAFGLKCNGGVYSFSVGSVLAAIVVFLVTSGGKLAFSMNVFGYAVAFAIAYTVSLVSSMNAIKTGPLSLTSLLISYSLIIPTVFGLIVFNETLTVWILIGILLLLVSLFLINRESKTEEKKITLKWGIFALLAFLGNGACSTIQKMQQIYSGGQYKTEFMVIALAISATILAGFAATTEKKNAVVSLKKGAKYYLLCGLANGMVNFLVLVLSNRMPASVMFPIISAGGIVLAALVSIFVYKERLQPQQWAGMVLGTLALVALNL